MDDFYYIYGGYYIYGWLLLHLWLVLHLWLIVTFMDYHMEVPSGANSPRLSRLILTS